MITATKNLSFTLMHRNDEVFLTKEIKKSLIFHPEKNLQFYEKEINPKEKKNIIVLDDSENIEFNNSFFCFCFSSKKKKKNLPDKLL